MLKLRHRKQTRMWTLRERLIFTVLILVGYRLLSHVPLPFVNPEYISSMLDGNGTLTFFNTLTGGGFEIMSLMALGITPYITASIILQLMGVVIPRLADMQREGATGRQTIERISIVLAAVLGFTQAVFMTWGYGKQGLLTTYTWYTVLIPAVLMTVGVFILSYAGQVITKHFFGNGTSLILLTGILASYLSDTNLLVDALIGQKHLWMDILFCVLAVIAVVALFWFTFYLNFCEKRIPVTYSQKVSTSGGMSRANTSVIPLKLIAGSVVPIIFASSIITIPSIVQSFTGTDVKWLWIFNSSHWFSADAPWATAGVLLYCVMIVGFSYYYNHLNLNEVELANTLQKRGGYIYGIRPGRPTAAYLKQQLKYMTFLGGLGLCVIALVPNVLTSLLGVSRLSFLGTSIIITVSVIVDTRKRFMAEYDSYGMHTKMSRTLLAGGRSLFGDENQKKAGKDHGKK